MVFIVGRRASTVNRRVKHAGLHVFAFVGAFGYCYPARKGSSICMN